MHGRRDLADRAESILRLVSGEMGTQPQAFARLLAAFDIFTAGASEVVIAGDRPDLVAAASGRYLPNTVVLWGEPFTSPAWEGRGGDQAYVCRNYTCALPTVDREVFDAQLSELGPPPS